MDSLDNITDMTEEGIILNEDNLQNNLINIQNCTSLGDQMMSTGQEEMFAVAMETESWEGKCESGLSVVDSAQQNVVDSTQGQHTVLETCTQQSHLLDASEIPEVQEDIRLQPNVPGSESLILTNHGERVESILQVCHIAVENDLPAEMLPSSAAGTSRAELELDSSLTLGACDKNLFESTDTCISDAAGNSQGVHSDISAKGLEGSVVEVIGQKTPTDNTVVSVTNSVMNPGESVESLLPLDENKIQENICSDNSKAGILQSDASNTGFSKVSVNTVQDVKFSLLHQEDMCMETDQKENSLLEVKTNDKESISYNAEDQKERNVYMHDLILQNKTVSISLTEDSGPPEPEQKEKLVSDNTGKSDFLTTCEFKESEEKDGKGPLPTIQSKEGQKSEENKKKKKAEEKVDEEPEFVWEKHLEETGSQAVPPTTFKHVESSLESGFVKGMKLEVPNKCNKDTYWVASVLMTCGPLLRLRFDGYEDDSAADFWCDLLTSEIHPIGWCAQNNQILQPPEAIKDKFEDWRDFLVKSLTGARTAPAYLLDKTTGITPVDQLKQGMRLELQHPINSVEVWLVKILENVGGRLYLRFEGLEIATHDFWLFYLNHRLHPVGWAKANGLKYQPPRELTGENTEVDWTNVLKLSMKEAEKCVLPLAVFKDQEEIIDHKFQKGMKLEALNPINKTQICPATVVSVLNSQYFVIEIDDLENTEPEYKIRFCCHSGSKCIFPVKWCHYNGGVSVSPPKGWPKPKLSWNDYLEHCNAEAAPESCFAQKAFDFEFIQGMKCEAVNPENPNQICVATISKVVEPLVWIHLDNSRIYGSSHIEHFESHNLFPVGWCESNGYQLRLPVISKRTAAVLPETYDATNEAYHSNTGGEWCPKVYYNHQCFSGPHLSKGRIASLPKCVGPGPINLVMKEVLSMLINVAYKPCRVLKELQLEGRPSPDMHQQTLKAKYKGKSYRAIVEICRQAENLPEFCRNVCLKLECCKNLISPTYINNECPEKCSLLTKTQYTYYNPKKKVGRPPGGHTNLENGPKKPGKKKKKRRMNILSENGGNGEENGSVGDGEEDKESVTSETKTVENNDNGEKPAKRKYVHQVPLPSDIKTRGAKLPKYSFERKTHKKIPIQEKPLQKPHRKSHNKEEQTTTSPHHISPVKTAMKLDSNPLYWSVQEVVQFIKGTECAPIARVFKEQEIDGQALLLLNLPTVQEYLDLKLGPAIKLCHHIEKIKVAFFQQYAH